MGAPEPLLSSPSTMTSSATDLHDAKAMVIDGNPQSRSIIVNQLRDAGVGTIVQVSRLVDARMKLEMTTFDVVICEQYFEREDTTGQDLLDDLRRNQLLPFYTVFVMITSESTYSKVAEAAESALDAYLLKPHTAAGLVERIHQARERKEALKDIFTAIERDDFEAAAQLCQAALRAATDRSGCTPLASVPSCCCARAVCADAQKLYEGGGGSQDPALGQAGRGPLPSSTAGQPATRPPPRWRA